MRSRRHRMPGSACTATSILALVALAVLALGPAVDAARATPSSYVNGVTGPQSIVVIPAGNSTQPAPDPADVTAVFQSVTSWLDTAAAGVATFSMSVAPSVTVPDAFASCGDGIDQLDDLRVAAQTAAVAQGFVLDPAAIVVVVGPVLCETNAAGVGSLGEAWVDYPDTRIAEHELGHAFGLLHAGSCLGDQVWALSTALPCPMPLVYGDWDDVMGSGLGIYNAYHLAKLHWSTLQPVAADGTYTLGAIERGGGGLAIDTAGTDYTVEFRDGSGIDANVWAPLGTAADVLVYRTPRPDDAVPSVDTMLVGALDPAPGTPLHDADPDADRLTVPGVFDIVASESPGGRSIAFQWLDQTPPALPELPVTVLGPTLWPTLLISGGQDDGSGFDHYDASIDGGPVLRVDDQASANDTTHTLVQTTPPTGLLTPQAPLTRGTHTLSAVAVDRAGNRSAVATRTFVVGQPYPPSVSLRLGNAGGCGSSYAGPCHREVGDRLQVQAWTVGRMPGEQTYLVVSRHVPGRFVFARRVYVTPGANAAVRVSLTLPRPGLWRVALAVGPDMVSSSGYVRVDPVRPPRAAAGPRRRGSSRRS